MKKSDFFPKQVIRTGGGAPRIEQRGQTFAATRPWEKLGMSESTWKRRRREYREQEKEKQNGKG
jgi:hypothetical protein